MNGHVLVVDDDKEMCNLLKTGLALRRFTVEAVQTGNAALDALGGGAFDVVITDLRMRGMNGLELCERIAANRPDIPVVVITAFGSMDSAVSAIRAGAFDYVAKPFEMDELAIAVERAVRHHALQDEVRRLRSQVQRNAESERLIGSSAPMRRLRDMITRIADSDSSVLITGETGTGKEVVARSLHDRSARRGAPFIAINCAAMPEQLLESELFGHTRGAFTDARRDHVGLISQADGGTLFLDEIADMPLQLQPKLLRALQERIVRPVGSTAEVPFDARVIAATNVDLGVAVEDKLFRADLYFRLNVINLQIPTLRARHGDILMLAQHFLRECASRADKPVSGISPAAARRLLDYSWPGNVRELQNCVEHAVAMTGHEQVTVDDLPEKLRTFPSWTTAPAADAEQLVPMHEVEKRYIARVMRRMAGNKRQAAKVLGFDRATLYRKLARYGIDTDADTGPEDG